MKRRVLYATVLLSLLESRALANPDPTPPTLLSGSDTMREISIDLIAACGVGSSLTYVGGGSSLGGTRMSPSLFGPNGMQQVSPQSRFLNATECSAVGPNQGQGIQIGLDGIAAFHDDTELSPCRVLRYAGCMDVLDLNNAATLGYGNGTAGIDDGTGASMPAQYCFTHWADVLRILYTGQHAHLNDSSAAAACAPGAPSASAIAARRCNSDVRRTLVENWANLFDSEGDDGAGGCADDHCTRLRHAFRRDDFSGTTDTFLSLIGAPALGSAFNVRTFCNGLENEDLDPIRRPCSTNSNANLDSESVCAVMPFKNRNAPFGADGSPSGQSGSTAPTPPAANSAGDLGLVLPISLPQDLTVQYDNNFCTTAPFGGSFKYAPMPAALSLTAQRCPDGNARTAGQCRYPVYAGGPNAGRFNCKSRRTNRPGSLAWVNFDARAYNLIPRDPVTGVIVQPNSSTILDPRWGGGGHYRLHMTAAQTSETAIPYASAHPTCTQPDATTQIGCLVQSDPCSIGYAGLEGEDQDVTPDEEAIVGTNLPFLMRGPLDLSTSELDSGDDDELEPRITTIQRLVDASGASCQSGTGDFDIRYPLARILWFNASKGFGGFPGTLPNISNMVDSDPDINPEDPTINGSLLPDGVADLLTRENDFARCYVNRALMDPILEAHGFITLPDALSYPDVNRFKTCP